MNAGPCRWLLAMFLWAKPCTAVVILWRLHYHQLVDKLEATVPLFPLIDTRLHIRLKKSTADAFDAIANLAALLSHALQF